MARSEQEIADRLWLVLEAVAISHPDMNMKEGVLLAQRTYSEINWLEAEGITGRPASGSTVDSADAKAFSEFIARDSEVVDFIHANQKISAIKRARTIVPGASLREAKDAVELLAAML